MNESHPQSGDARQSPDEFRPLACDPKSISFHVAANDQEILRKVRSMMQQSGLVGVSDTAGRLHYIVDGARGTPFATRQIISTISRCSQERDENARETERHLPEAIDRVLDRCSIRHELKGRAYLQLILYLAVLDERKLKPLSKTLYPEAASHFKARSSQVERDIRYTFSCASEAKCWPEGLSTGNTARISYLCSETQRELRRMSLKAVQPDSDGTRPPLQ